MHGRRFPSRGSLFSPVPNPGIGVPARFLLLIHINAHHKFAVAMLKKPLIREHGFSLVELLIAVVMIAVGLLAFGTFSGIVTDRSEDNEKKTVAVNLAQDKLEYFKNLSLKTTLSSALNGTDTVNAAGTAGTGAYYTRVWTISTSGTLHTVTVTVTWADLTSHTVTLSTLINQ
jgi:type IV pilus assembly protein PilV